MFGGLVGCGAKHTPPAAAETPKLKRKKANKADAVALDAAAPAAADAAAGALKLKSKKAKKTDAAAPDAAAHAAADASKGQGSGAPPQSAPKAAAPPPPPATTAPVPAESKREQLKRKFQEAKAAAPMDAGCDPVYIYHTYTHTRTSIYIYMHVYMYVLGGYVCMDGWIYVHDNLCVCVCVCEGASYEGKDRSP
jgi:hypothetical protein